MKPKDQIASPPMFKNLKDIFRVLGKYKWYYLGSTIMLFISIIARSLEPKVLQVAVDTVLSTEKVLISNDFVSVLFDKMISFAKNDPAIALVILGIIYLIISAVRGGFLFFSSTVKDMSTQHTIKKLRDRVYEHIQRLPMSYFSGISKGELIQRCTGDIDTVKDFIHQQIVAVLRLSGTFLFSFFMMYLIDPLYAVVSVALAPVIFILGFVFFSKERKVWYLHEEEADKLNTMVQENLNGIRVVAAFSNQDYEIERFHKQNLKKLQMGLKQANLHTLFWPITDFVVNLQMIISVIAGGYFALSGRITIGELLGFYTYISMVTFPMRQLGKVLSQMGMAIVAMGRISEIIEFPTEDDKGTYVPEMIFGEIEFKNVSFTYTTGNSIIKALDDVSFKIAPGEQVAIIGATGAGKSTLIKLLLRLYEPDNGQILLDGRSIDMYPKSFLRQKIGVSLQKAFLFSTTINNNIAYAQESSIQDEIDRAASIAGAFEMKKAFPHGFDTMVGEKGVTLSGGQKQRVALARTVIVEPDIIVLDDTTSAVDTATERAILNELDQSLKGKTALIISHRIASIRKAERIIVMDKGKIVQIGTSEQLDHMAGYYQAIQDIQTGVESDILQSQSNIA